MKVTNMIDKGVIGIDEVGRGPLAGPVMVCAVYIEDTKAVLRDLFQNTLRDSKKINKTLRYNIYQTIRKKRYINTRVEYSIQSRDAAYIDSHGINQAIQECVDRCVLSLKGKGISVESLNISLDGGLRVSNNSLHQNSYIRGDEQLVEIALASILAKEERDAHMRSLHARYPHYAWERNVGYGTKQHREAIEVIGTTKYHRKTYLKAFKLLDKAE